MGLLMLLGKFFFMMLILINLRLMFIRFVKRLGWFFSS